MEDIKLFDINSADFNELIATSRMELKKKLYFFFKMQFT